MNVYRRPLLRALAGLSINTSAAFFAVAFIGPHVAFPKTPEEFTFLTVNIVFGIVFLLLTIWCERRLEQ